MPPSPLPSPVQDLNALPLPALFTALIGNPRAHDSPLRRLLDLARDEDLGHLGDITSFASIPEHQQGTARLIARESMTLAGIAVIPAIVESFASARIRIDLFAQDGDTVVAKSPVAEFTGPLRDILAFERTLLNLLSRLSGVATTAAEFVARVSGTRTAILDTRKTTPGLRALEKYAVRCGGALCHRIGLFDAMLIKDNHIAGVSLSHLPAFVTQAVARAKSATTAAERPLSFIELEVDSLDQFSAILDAGGCAVDIVLLDNMPPDRLREAVALRDRSGLRIQLEASGGVNLNTVRAIAETGVERISAGAITHHAVSRDLALDIA